VAAPVAATSAIVGCSLTLDPATSPLNQASSASSSSSCSCAKPCVYVLAVVTRPPWPTLSDGPRGATKTVAGGRKLENGAGVPQFGTTAAEQPLPQQLDLGIGPCGLPGPQEEVQLYPRLLVDRQRARNEQRVCVHGHRRTVCLREYVSKVIQEVWVTELDPEHGDFARKSTGRRWPVENRVE
jgi:hypothetical protein